MLVTIIIFVYAISSDAENSWVEWYILVEWLVEKSLMDIVTVISSKVTYKIHEVLIHDFVSAINLWKFSNHT